MFRATARLGVPEGLKLDELRKALEKLAAEIMVDLNVGEREPAWAPEAIALEGDIYNIYTMCYFDTRRSSEGRN